MRSHCIVLNLSPKMCSNRRTLKEWQDFNCMRQTLLRSPALPALTPPKRAVQRRIPCATSTATPPRHVTRNHQTANGSAPSGVSCSQNTKLLQSTDTSPDNLTTTVTLSSYKLSRFRKSSWRSAVTSHGLYVAKPPFPPFTQCPTSISRSSTSIISRTSGLKIGD